MKTYKLLIVILLIGGLWSCEKDSELDFFEKQYPNEAPWLSATDFEQAVIGSYWLLSGNNSGRNPFMAQRLTLEATSDGVYYSSDFGSDASVGDLYERRSDLNVRYPDAVFNTGYMAIGTPTDALNYLETGENNNPFPTHDVNYDQVPRMEGEIRFVRAFSWWLMSTMFTPMYNPDGSNDEKRIPWLEKIPAGLDGAVNGELATTQQVYDIMVDDLLKAIDLLPEKFDADKHPPHYEYGRANKYAAKALLMRVYFQMNKFDEAEKLCDDIIDFSESTGHYSLDQEPIEAFNKAFGFEGNGTEVIWYYLQYEGDGVGSWKNQWIAERMSKCRRYGDTHAGRNLACSDYFLEEVGWQDPVTKEPTEEALNDKRYNQLYHRYLASSAMPEGYETPDDGVYESQFSTDRPYVWGNKYYRDENERLKTNIPIFRLPEVYLTRAIIRLKDGDSTGALSDLNKVRESRGLDALTSVTEEDIHNERWKELNFEGDRVNYLRALHMDIPDGDRGQGSVDWNAPVWEWPVPQRESELNNAYEN